MKKFLISIVIIMPALLGAQSYHFSQFYSTPLLMNPANTGYFDGNFRVATNYRSQWSGNDEPYTTLAASVELSPMRSRLAEGNRLGIGIAIANDKTMAGAVQQNFIGVSAAYNITLDQEDYHHIGLGFQGAYKERKIDFSHLTFENQLGSGGFDITLPTGETIPGGRRGYFDMNVGAMYNYTGDGKYFFSGVSVFNLLKQKDTYMEGGVNMPKRYSLLAGGRVDVGYSGILSFSLNYQTQGAVSETTIGTAYGIQLGDEKKQVISLGAWHRLNDAVIPYLGYQLNGFQAGISYDYTTSKLKTSGQVRNGFELSFVFTAQDNSEMKRLVPWY